MKTILTIALLSFSFAHAADPSCQDNIQQKQQELKQVEQRYQQGQATVVELLDAKVVLADTMYKCGQFVKYNYCHYKQTLLGTKIRNLSGADQDAAKKDLGAFQTFCLDPKQ